MMVCLVSLVLPRSIQGPTNSCSNDSNGHSNLAMKTDFLTSVMTLSIILGRMLYKVPNLAMNGG